MVFPLFHMLYGAMCMAWLAVWIMSRPIIFPPKREAQPVCEEAAFVFSRLWARQDTVAAIAAILTSLTVVAALIEIASHA